MLVHSPHGDAESFGDRRPGEVGTQQGENFPFPCRQRVEAAELLVERDERGVQMRDEGAVPGVNIWPGARDRAKERMLSAGARRGTAT